YDATGKIVLHGERPDRDVADRFKDLLKSLSEEHRALLGGQSPTLPRDLFDHAAVLVEMRRTVTEKALTDVWVERLYFDAGGKLTLLARGADSAARDGLKARLGSKERDSQVPDHPWPVTGSPTDALRASVKRSGLKWVYVHPGRFDADSHYAVTGVIDRDAQKEEVRKLINQVAAEAAYRESLAAGVADRLD